ncbi:MAG: Fis family transcriptional regulator [Nitrospirae bacterium CG_4_10_14_0_8_um_filter_41_23]|nr:sigma-54-dependent Fis family transcriptional regulator [Nitrospirota bacterium]OIP60059.1 MAG: Fis family transcriptional regulator [Nitrospirae bacterium CG2_30_41_42]PIV42587.1 MAG: Fis family transcriptional regulator [Nitrospirae bacterium CG02_land_8_20_14_3_00_41_53]PIW87465.1 MAG: Fis family transcriptional regulator [Nitrospirae bacterium CG_4_8_14_3_um_filter_41_47]PIY87193.1 MAG: Fis family transcriptional regulator [Nitrospirae bacterium CG_4_10_14_0_8_um_filter_41_23]PJA79701.1
MKKHNGKILVVEDEKSMREVLKILLDGENYEVMTASDGLEGLSSLDKDIFDLVITDMKMPKADGFQVLKKVKEISPDTIVIMITAFGTRETAIEAMKLGAYNYINKPFNIDEIRLIVKRAIEKKKLSEELSVLKEKVETIYTLENIVGQSPKMQEMFKLIPRIAQSKSNVLIIGESGSGKELVATALHNLSHRKEKNFITINCAAFSEGILESELFGHMKGAFTGAMYNKQGLFEIADGGSVFLDEIGEMPISLQAKLLRVIENGTFRRVGGTNDIKVDVRVISATNKDIKEEVSSGRFREDLFYRLNVVPVNIPPLRERKEDIPLLVDHFLKKTSDNPKRITPKAMKLLMDYSWKGNVRELENIIERTALLTDKEEIVPAELPTEITGYQDDMKYISGLTEEGINIDKVIGDIEKRYLLQALEIAGGVKTEAAKLLNLSFRSFRHRLHKYNIS